MKIEVKYCPKDNNYYLQCLMESRSLRRHMEETQRQMIRESNPEARNKLQTELDSLARERAYMTDYILLRREEIPAGCQIRRLPSRPKKLVTVNRETKKWLLSRVPVPVRADEKQAASAGRCYDLPAEQP
ncbi:MAG: hypothetical protein LUD69_06925 [Oscillospiraceae bacterium]|nr:hypothetical protein [Oscillospiraceae bacterium]